MDIMVWRNSEIECLKPIEYNSSHVIVKSGIFGATRGQKCLTCNQLLGICQGHWGRIELPEPVVRPSFTNMLNSLLSRLCLHCGVKVVITGAEENILTKYYPFINIQTKEYIDVVTRLRKSSDLATKCRRCGTQAHKLKLVDGIFTDVESSVSHRTIYRLLASIPYHHYPIFTSIKFALTDLFFTSYPIAPLYLRSGIEYEGMIIDSEITKLYQELFGKISSYNTPAIQRTVDDLEINDSNMPLSSFAKPFLGKYTLFRSLINSYSGDNTIRNVLNVNTSPSPDDGYFCRQFYSTIPVKLYYNDYTKHLIEKLKDRILYVRNGDRYLKLKGPVMLEGGDYVEVLSADSITIGYYPNMVSYRQPSLHKPSIVAQIIKYKPYDYGNGNSSTLSTTAIPGMNGDQDGDEFNSRLVTSIAAQYEHMMIMRPRTNLINDSTSSLTYGMIQLEVLHFIKQLTRHGSKFYQDLLPNCLRDAVFETISGDEISASKKSSNLFKNVQQLSSPVDAWRLFIGIVKRVKNTLGREKMAFMLTEIYQARDIIKKVETKKRVDLEILQSDIIKMYQEGIAIDAKFITSRIAQMTSEYEKDIKSWLDGESIMTNDYALISHAKLKVNPRMLMELLVMQRSETVTEPSTYYLNRVNSIYPTNSLDLNAYGLITGCYFNGLEMKDLLHTFGPARKKLIITSVMTALPGMISRNMNKTMEDMHIDYCKFVTNYRLVIDFNHNFYKLPTSQLYLIPTKTRKQMLFPLDLPFILRNIHTLMPSKELPMEISKQHELIKKFAYRITEQYMYSFGCVHLYYIEVLNELEPLPQPVLQYILDLIEMKYKLYPAVGEPIGVHTATTIGELLTQSTLSNFHTVKKGGDDISLDADANNISLIQFSRTKKDRIITMNSSNNQVLIDIRRSIELVTLEDLGYELLHFVSSKKPSNKNIECKIMFRVRRSRLATKNLTINDLEDIITNNIDEINYIESATLSTTLMKYHVGVKLDCTIANVESVRLLTLALRSFIKGTHRCNITDNKLMIETQDLKFLSHIDMTEITISIPPELQTVSPLMAYQSLLNNYSVSGIQWLPYRTLSLFQTRYGFPIGIRKYQTVGQPVISKMSHQRAYHDLQKAAAVREVQLTSVPSSILLNKPISLGTGYFNVSHNIGSYIYSVSDKQTAELQELIL